MMTEKTPHYLKNPKSMPPTLFLLVFTLLALMVHQGCAHAPGPILSESLQNEIQHIGVLVTEGSEKSLEDSRRGWLSSMGAGAARGSLAGSAGILCYIGAIICVPVLAAAGAVGGSVYGLYQASTETLPADVESLLRQAIADTPLPTLLMQDLVGEGKAAGYEMAPIKHLPRSGESAGEEGLRPALHDSFDTILLIEGPVVNLLPATYETNPPRRMGLSARVRVIRTADQDVLDDRLVLEELGDVHLLEEWTADQAQHFREELPRAIRRLSEKILIDYFMRSAFEKRTYALRGPGLNGLFPFWEYRLKGLAIPKIRARRDLSPEKAVVESRSPDRVDSVTPTLRWEPFIGQEVTYDLKIWESKPGSRTQIGGIIYSKEGITKNAHTIQTNLNSSTIYTWSVRAKFLDAGKGCVTEWSKYQTGFTMFGKVITLGFMALLESTLGEEWGFYQFQTP